MRLYKCTRPPVVVASPATLCYPTLRFLHECRSVVVWEGVTPPALGKPDRTAMASGAMARPLYTTR